jgi:HEAT repeat protein
MKQRIRFGLAMVLIAVLVGLGLWLRPSDPDFHGKPESFWINSITNSDDHYADFPMDGVPILVKALSKGTGTWERFYGKIWQKLPSALSERLPKPADESEFRRSAAVRLRVMGTNAQIAVPALVRALRDDNDGVRMQAIGTLSALLAGMGQERIHILPQIIEAARDPFYCVRYNSMFCLGKYSDQGKIVVPVVVNALADSSSYVRYAAIKSIMQLDALGANKTAVPVLLKLLEDGNAQVREAATNALSLLQAERTTDVTDVTDKEKRLSPPSNP